MIPHAYVPSDSSASRQVRIDSMRIDAYGSRREPVALAACLLDSARGTITACAFTIDAINNGTVTGASARFDSHCALIGVNNALECACGDLSAAFACLTGEID